MLSIRAASVRLPPLRSKARRISISSSRANAVDPVRVEAIANGLRLADEAEIRSVNDGAARQDGGALHRILQFADIARPVVPEQARRRIGGELLAAASAEEMLSQRDDVGDAFAQWRQMYRHDVQPVEQILAKLPLANPLRQILVGGGDHPDIDSSRLAADRSHDALLQRPQDFCLHREIHVADLVK